jgi:hypothetical protein
MNGPGTVVYIRNTALDGMDAARAASYLIANHELALGW